MKRAREDESTNDETPSKRLKPSVSIASTDLDAVRAAFHTDCELIAAETSDVSPTPRVFPVNRLVLCGWSVPFSVMVNGSFREGLERRIELPFSGEVVEIGVRHMYSTCNLEPTPVIPPHLALNVMRLAHMYDQVDLFQRAMAGILDLKRNLDVPTLRAALLLGVNVASLVTMILTSRTVFPPFSIDSNDEVFAPFLAELYSRRITFRARKILLAPTIFSDAMRDCVLVALFRPDDWDAHITFRQANLSTMEVAEKDRWAQIEQWVAAAPPRTRCGVTSLPQMRHVLGFIPSTLTREQEVEYRQVAGMQTGSVDRRHEFFDAYSRLMRLLYITPGPAPPAPQ